MSSRRALVAGSCGFIGSYLSESLLADGYEVVGIDNLASGQRDNVDLLSTHDDFTFIEDDIRDPPELPEVDEVYHMASRASPTDFEDHPIDIATTNAEGTRNLLEYAAEIDAKMLYSSTSEVYGDPKIHPQTEEYNGNVNIRGPRSCYDESKRFGETLSVAYRKERDLDVRTVRIFNTYGPRMRVDDGRVIPNFLRQAICGDDLTVYGDGSQTRSFCYVSDLVDGLRRVMDVEEMEGDVVNLGSDQEITIKTLAEIVLDIYDTESEITYKPLPEDDPSKRRPDLSKARDLLDYETSVDLCDGLEKTFDFFEARVESG